MKIINKVVCIAVSLLFVLSVCGCTVNEEKLASSAVAKVNDTEILKSQMNEIVNFTAVYYYATTGQDITEDEDSFNTMKEDIVNDMVERELIKTVADKYGYKVDEKEVKDGVDNLLAGIEDSQYISDDDYLEVLQKYGFKDEKSFKEAVTTYSEAMTYTNGFMDKFRNEVQGKGYATSTYMTVDDIDVPAYIYYYVYIQKTIEEEYNSYMNSYYSASDSSAELESKTPEEIKEDTEETIKEKAAFYAEGTAKKLQVTDETINNIKEQNAQYDSMYDAETMESVYNAYGITKEQYDKAATWVATADAYKNKLHDEVSYEKPTEEDAKKEFEKNTKQYDTSTVSAKHILTQDKDLAKEIYEQATKDGANFDDLMSKYQNDESVEQASDLGAFKYSDMVEDFSKAAFDAEKGEVIGPVKTEYGYHVVYVYDKNIVEPKFEDSMDQILVTLDADRKAEAASKLDEKIKKEHKYEILRTGIDEPFNMFMADLKENNKIKTYKSVIKK